MLKTCIFMNLFPFVQFYVCNIYFNFLKSFDNFCCEDVVSGATPSLWFMFVGAPIKSKALEFDRLCVYFHERSFL